MNARRLIPAPAKRILIRAFLFFVSLSCAFRPRTVALALAGMLPPPGRFIKGGKVKLLHLRERFGDRRWLFNTLYLVSSTLPSNPDLWVHALKRFGVRIVWNQNGVAYPAWAGTQKNIERVNMPMRLLQKADHVIYQSRFCKESADRWVVTTAGQWSVIPNCVDTRTFSPRPRPTDRPLTLVSMGSHFTPEKILLVLEALALLRKETDARLFLAGRFDWPGAEAQIQEVISRLNLTAAVRIHGAFLQEEAPDLYRRGDIFIHLKYMDPCPTAVIEAMACGLPVIGSASGGMPELVDDRSGILLPVPKDWEKLNYPTAEAVTGAIQKLAASLPEYSLAARNRALEYFDKQQWIERHEQLFNELLATR